MTLQAINTFGNVWPPKPALPLPDKDPREHALERLREYICALEFMRTGDVGGKPIPFRLPLNTVFIAQPDSLVDLPLPGVGIVPGRGAHNTFGLGPPEVRDETFNVFAPGTAVAQLGEYSEVITIEVWGSKIAERRALMAGLKQAFRASDSSTAIYLSLPSYFGSVASFELVESLYIDGDEVARNRRRGHLFLNMRVCELALVNVVSLQVLDEVTVIDGNVSDELC